MLPNRYFHHNRQAKAKTAKMLQKNAHTLPKVSPSGAMMSVEGWHYIF